MDVTHNIGSLLKWVLLSNTVRRNRQLCLLDCVALTGHHPSDSDGSPPHLASLRRMTETLERETSAAMFDDEFDEFRARADSGGFLLHRWHRRRRRRADVGTNTPRSRPGSAENIRDDDEEEEEEDTHDTTPPELPSVANTSPIDIPAAMTLGARCHSLSYPGKSYETATDDLWDVTRDMRRRVSTLPETTFRNLSRVKTPLLGQLHRCPLNEVTGGSLRRIRSFKITPKGLVVSTSDGSERDGSGLSRQISSRSASSGCSSASMVSRSSFTILLTGAKGVGKTHILRQFLLPATHVDTGYSFDDDQDSSVTILLDGEESTLEFVDRCDRPAEQSGDMAACDQLDAYVVVYSVEDRKSFATAMQRLREIRSEEGRPVAVILVANKTDLVRRRVVPEIGEFKKGEDGKTAAKEYDCKYIEVSAAIDHKIDELLVGILKQIRLIRQVGEGRRRASEPARLKHVARDTSCCPLKAKQGVLRLLCGDRGARSCKNLYVL